MSSWEVTWMCVPLLYLTNLHLDCVERSCLGTHTRMHIYPCFLPPYAITHDFMNEIVNLALFLTLYFLDKNLKTQIFIINAFDLWKIPSAQRRWCHEWFMLAHFPAFVISQTPTHVARARCVTLMKKKVRWHHKPRHSFDCSRCR